MRNFCEVLLLLVIFFFAGLAGYKFGSDKPAKIEYVSDTITITDTITIVEPVEVIHEVMRDRYEYVYVTDTVIHNDTVYAVLPRERKVYQDSLSRVVISGIRPSLDSLQVYPKMQVITIREPEKRWHIGLSAGVGLQQNKMTTFVGVGVTYSLCSF